MNPTPDEYEALAVSYRRLRAAARAVVNAASYDEDGRVYASQLRALKRELEGEAQPTNRLCWMSPT